MDAQMVVESTHVVDSTVASLAIDHVVALEDSFGELSFWVKSFFEEI